MAVPPVARSTPPTRKAALTSFVKPGADAVICLFVPASLHSTLVKVAVPLPAAEPMSKVVVPSREPEPEDKDRERLQLAGSPTADVLPNASRATTAGCVASGEPVRDVPPGWVVKASWLAVLGPTTMLPEVALVKPLAVKLIVIVVALVCDRLLKVAKPLTVVAVSGPCNVPVPALRAAVRTRPLSVVTRLPAASSTRITGCWANATPAVAVDEGWV